MKTCYDFAKYTIVVSFLVCLPLILEVHRIDLILSIINSTLYSNESSLVGSTSHIFATLIYTWDPVLIFFQIHHFMQVC